MPDPSESPSRLHVHALFVLGPTAIGKTALGVALARATGAEIVSCDSRQIYRGMSIGTASPTPRERDEVAHHLVGVADPDTSWSAGRWAREARAVVRALARRGRGALIVGGSGLYARALRRGLARIPSNRAVRTALERRLETEGATKLHAELERKDPPAARAIHPRNRQRLLRALEVHDVTGRPLSEIWSSTAHEGVAFGAPAAVLEMDRRRLRERIERRAAGMFRAGLLEEVARIRSGGFGPDWPSYRTLGYDEACRMLDGEIDEAAALEAITAATWQYARRQMTWFGGEPDTVPIPVGENPDGALSALLSLYRASRPVPVPEEIEEEPLLDLDGPQAIA